MARRSAGSLVVLIAMGCVLTIGEVVAQEGLVTTEVRSGEVVWVSGSTLVVRLPEGVRQLEVPADFRFDMDGKQLTVGELKPGMKVTATVKTTQTPVTLYETTVREATVIETLGTVVVLKGEDGTVKRFTVDDLREMKISATRDGKSITAYDLRKGDKISATVYTPKPATATTQEVTASVQAPPPPPPRPAAPPSPAAAAAPRQESPTPAETLPKTSGPLPWVGLVGAVILGGGLGLTVLRRRMGW